jgi:hypothetical protein
MDPSRPWDAGWRWWIRLGVIVLGSLAAAALITFGALRFLDQAQREHDRVECLRVQVQHQAGSNAGMARAVLDPKLAVDQRRAAVMTWSDEQGRIADLIGRC